MRRNFVIIDDVPAFARQLITAINSYYEETLYPNFKIDFFFDENHFAKSKKYILDNIDKIDIICSDENLAGGTGTQIFKSLQIKIDTAFASVKQFPLIFRVMHSNQYSRFSENQNTFRELYDYFINSTEYVTIKNFLDFYEAHVMGIKIKGNPNYHSSLYTKDLTVYTKPATEMFKIGKENIQIKDILFMVADINDLKKDYYFVVYKTDESIIFSTESIKPDFHRQLNDLLFVAGNLKDDRQALCKINPLWISVLNLETRTVKMFTPFSFGFEISFKKFKNKSDISFDKNLTNFFL